MSQREEVETGDLVEVNIRFHVVDVEHLEQRGQGFTTLVYVSGEPDLNGEGSRFCVEVPDEFGRVIILKKKEES